MIIVAIQNGGSTVAANRILTIRPLLLLGTVSYSWYLWHWPTINLLETAIAEPKTAHRVLFAAISLAIAAVSYRFVENPIRRSQIGTLKPVGAVVAAVFAAGMIYVGTGVWQSAANSWSKLPSQLPYLQVRRDTPKIYPLGCDSWYFSPNVRPCSFGRQDSEREVVILGDSVIGQWFSPLASLYTRNGYKVTVITKSSCPLVNAQIQYRGSRYVVCEQWREDAIRKIEERAPDVVIVGSSAGYMDIDLADRASLTAPLMRRLSLVTDKLLMFAPIPILPDDGLLCGARSEWRKRFSIQTQKCEWVVANDRHIYVTNGLHSIAANLPNAYVIDLNPFVCPSNKCQVVKHGLPVFRNEGHVSNAFANSITSLIAQSINSAVTK